MGRIFNPFLGSEHHARSVELRHHWNRRDGFPWDTPIFPPEFQAVHDWENHWAKKFLPGENMAEWDGFKIEDWRKDRSYGRRLVLTDKVDTTSRWRSISGTGLYLHSLMEVALRDCDQFRRAQPLSGGELSLMRQTIIAKNHTEPNEFPITLTTFPRLGIRGYAITPYSPLSGERLRSQFLHALSQTRASDLIGALQHVQDTAPRHDPSLSAE